MSNIEEKKAREKEIVKNRIKDIWADKRSYKKRLIIAGAAFLAACFTFIFFGPIELVAFSGGSLVFSYRDVIWLMLGAFLVVWVALSFLVSLLRGKVFNYTVCVVFAFTLSGYIQAMFLNSSLGTLTGDAIDWHALKFELILGLVVWVAILIACFTLMYLHKRIWANTIKYVSLALVLVQIVPLIGIIFGAYETKNVTLGESKLTIQGMYDYSENKNTFVFVLDRLDYDYIEEVLKEDPAFFDNLDGFTMYDNAISSFARTKPALNHILTGCEELAYNVSESEYFKNSWFEDEKDILRDISEEGYSVEIYTEANALFSDKNYMERYIKNYSSGFGNMNYPTAFSKLINLSVYRYAPIFIKPFFWADTTYYNNGVLNADNSAPYTFDDPLFMGDLKNGTASLTQNSFKFFHFNGPHAPYNMDRNGNNSPESTSPSEQLIGCMKHLGDLFEKMKELGIYDDATIIITADHGAAMYDDRPLVKATRIGLFYKPSGKSGETLKHSSAPVCTDNISATIIKSVGAEYSKYGRALDDIGENEDITRYYYKSVTQWGGADIEVKVHKYEVKGDASKFENWVEVEQKDIEHSFYGI